MACQLSCEPLASAQFCLRAQAIADGLLRSVEDCNLADRVLTNATACCAAEARRAYDAMLMRDALKHSMFEMLNARCAPRSRAGCATSAQRAKLHALPRCVSYKLQTASMGTPWARPWASACVHRRARVSCRDAYREQLGAEGMHPGVVRTFIDALVRMTAPIVPHWADDIFRNVLKAGDTVLTAGWPELPEPDLAVKKAGEYVDKTIARVRAAVDKKEAPPKKKKGATPPIA
jgi:Anticodon-binding domain of tRNA ligase